MYLRRERLQSASDNRQKGARDAGASGAAFPRRGGEVREKSVKRRPLPASPAGEEVPTASRDRTSIRRPLPACPAGEEVRWLTGSAGEMRLPWLLHSPTSFFTCTKSRQGSPNCCHLIPAFELLHLPDKPAGVATLLSTHSSRRTSSPAGQAGRGRRPPTFSALSRTWERACPSSVNKLTCSESGNERSLAPQ